MITQLKPYLWKLNFKIFGSTVYVLKHNKKNIIIDTGSLANRPELKKDLKSIGINTEDINLVLLTHKHFDHDGNSSIFENAKVYGSKLDFKKDNILDITTLKIRGLKIILTPGHSRGGICLLLNEKEDKILFSGDTIFDNSYIGRTDLHGSNKEDMKKSLAILKDTDYNLLCSGHDY